MSWVDTPRGVALVFCAAALLGATFGFWAGYQIGSAPPQTIVVHLDAPLVVK